MLMLAALAAGGVILALSWIVGRAVLGLWGPNMPSTLSPPIGLAMLIVVVAPVVHFGRGQGGALALAALAVAAGTVLFRLRISPVPPWEAWIVSAVLMAAAALPYVANGRFGILGMGVLNDLASHLLWTDAVRTGDPAMLAFIFPNYPLGPHSLVAAVASALSIGSYPAMAGLLLVLPALIGCAAIAGLDMVPRPLRPAAAVLVGGPYLLAAHVARGAYKEPLVAAMLIVLVLLIERINRSASWDLKLAPLVALPVASAALTSGLSAAALVITAGSVWVAARVAVERLSRKALLRGLVRVGLAALGLALLFIGWNLLQLVRFSPSLGGAFAEELPVEMVLGLWLTPLYPPFPPNEFHTGLLAGLGLAAALFGLADSIRRREFAVPAALVAGLALYVVVRIRAYGYVSVKALAQLAPLVMLMTLGALLRRSPRSGGAGAPRLRVTLGIMFMAAAAYSSWIPLVHANVSSEGRASQLERVRPRVAGSNVVFLGESHFVWWYLRGARVTSPFEGVQLRSAKPYVPGTLVDFDSFDADMLDRFRFALSTSSSYASAPPPNWHPILKTEAYVLWERRGPTEARGTLSESGAMGANLDCGTSYGQRLRASGGTASIRTTPVLARPDAWVAGLGPSPGSPSAIEAGRAISQEVDLPRGRWELSLQYSSPVGLTVRLGALRRTLPPSLDVFGPLWRVGFVEGKGLPQRLGLRAHAPSTALATRYAIVGAVAFTRVEPPRLVPVTKACGQYIDWFLPADPAGISAQP